MIIQNLNSSRPQREPLPRTWFLSRGYKKADPAHTNGYAIWLHPETNNVLNQYGQRMALQLIPYEKFKQNTTRYLKLSRQHGSMYLARLKYLTFIGPIPEGCTIDHIDGNTLNNSIDNLRAVTPEINRRDGGFLRKLRNHGINVAMYHTSIILEGFENMAKWKASHTEYRYKRLTRTELLRFFLGDDFRVDTRSSDEIMLDEMTHHQEI